MPSHQRHPYITILTPSITGLIIYALISISTLSVQALHNSQILYDITGTIRLESNFLQQINKNITDYIGASWVASAPLYIFWGLVGLILYILIRGAMANLGEFLEDISIRKYIWPTGANRNRPLMQFFEKSLFRISVGIITIIYAQYILRFLFSESVTSFLPGSSWLDNHKVIDFGLIFIVEVVLMHGLVVLLRLIALRERLFGSIQEAE